MTRVQVDVSTLLEQADSLGLLAPEYVWIAVEGSMWRELSASDAQLSTRLNGMLSFEANPTPSPRFRMLADAWSALTPADCAPVAEHMALPASLFAEMPSYYAAFAYDAVAAIAIALAASERTHNGSEVLEVLRARRFVGASGPVAFDAGNDRSEAIYSLTTFTERSTAGLAQKIVRVIPSGSTAGDVINQSVEAPLVWRDGSEWPDAVPSDLERDRKAVMQTMVIAFAVVGSVLGALMLVSAVYLSIRLYRWVRAAQLRDREAARARMRLIATNKEARPEELPKDEFHIFL